MKISTTEDELKNLALRVVKILNHLNNFKNLLIYFMISHQFHYSKQNSEDYLNANFFSLDSNTKSNECCEKIQQFRQIKETHSQLIILSQTSTSSFYFLFLILWHASLNINILLLSVLTVAPTTDGLGNDEFLSLAVSSMINNEHDLVPTYATEPSAGPLPSINSVFLN